MVPTRDQMDRYFRRLQTNYDDLIKLMADSKQDLNTILSATDKPIPKAESFGVFALETALFVVMPQAAVILKGRNLLEAGVALVEAADQAKGLAEKFSDTKDRAGELIRARQQVSTQYDNVALSMITIVNGMSDKLYRQKALVERMWDTYGSLLTKKDAQPLFNKIDWNNLPSQVDDNATDIRYAFTYILLRQAVTRFVLLKIRMWDPYRNGAGNLIVGVDPVGISQAGCDYIFSHYTRSLGGANPYNNTPGTPSAARIVPIRNFVDMVEFWVPDVELTEGSHEDLVKTLDEQHPLRTTQRIINEDHNRRIVEGIDQLYN